MKMAGILSVLILILAVMAFSSSASFAATDGFYQLTQAGQAMWDGTDANRQKPRTADYTYTYGDEAVLTYTLPWSINFYGQFYTQINIDTNGNIWFGATSSAHSFNLATTGRGSVIAAWNNDLSSYYYGGVFVQHKTNPERVVIEWRTETYTEEGFNRPNSFEVVLYQDGNIRFDYKSYSTTSGKDFGSGISKGDGTASLSLTSLYGDFIAFAGRSFMFNGIPKISVTPTPVNFGNSYIGLTTLPKTITVKNQGIGTLTIGSPITLGGADASRYSITANGCIGQGLYPSQSCTIQATFSPIVFGVKTANLLIPSNDPTTPTTTVPITGNGIWPTLAVTKNGAGSGVVNVAGGFSCGQTCSSTFVTGTPLTLTAAPDANSLFFGWSGGGCSGTGSCTVVLNADTYVTATFKLLPVRRKTANTYYTSLTAALSGINDGETIQLQALTFLEGATITKSITLDGGYDDGYVNKVGLTTLKGSQVNINDGIVTIKDVMIDK